MYLHICLHSCGFHSYDCNHHVSCKRLPNTKVIWYDFLMLITSQNVSFFHAATGLFSSLFLHLDAFKRNLSQVAIMPPNKYTLHAVIAKLYVPSPQCFKHTCMIFLKVNIGDGNMLKYSTLQMVAGRK